MTWRDFTIYIDDKITIHFPENPQPDKVGCQVLELIVSKGFTRLGVKDFIYQRDRTDFWVEQCKKLAAKCGASVVDTPNIIPEAPNIIPEAPNITEMQEMRQEMRQQMAAMQAEIVKLKQEVEELKKLDAIG